MSVSSGIVGIGVQTGGIQTVGQPHLSIEPCYGATSGVGVQITAIGVVVGGATPTTGHRCQ